MSGAPFHLRYFLYSAGSWLFVGLVLNVVCVVLQPAELFEAPRNVAWAVFSWIQWGLASVIVLECGRRIRIDGSNWTRTLPIHLGLAVVTTALCMALGFAVRKSLGLTGDQTLLTVLVTRLPHVMFMLGLPFYGGSVAAAQVLQYRQRSREQALMAAQLRARLADAELELVRRHIQPAFLFESLTAIERSLGNDAERAEEIILRLADFLRLAVRDSARDTSSVADQIQELEAYRTVRSVSGNPLPLSVEASGDVLDAQLPCFAISSFALRMSRPGNLLTLALSRSETAIELRVAGASADAETLDAVRSSFGGSAVVVAESAAMLIRIREAEEQHVAVA